MSHSLTKIWIHAIWSTKERFPLIIPPVELKVHAFMQKELEEMGCPVRAINGMADHVHCLFLLNPQKAIADTIKQVKGSSSHWITEQDLIKARFSWQTGYAAYSVSESVLDKVQGYILNQKQHHSKVTFQKEYDDFISVHGLQLQ